MAASLAGCSNMAKCLASVLFRIPRQLSCTVIPRSCLHSSSRNMADFDPEYDLKKKRFVEGPQKFLSYNDAVYPPTKEGEDMRPAEICHLRSNIMTSSKKFWYAAVLVRGLSIDEAIKQCTFSKKLYPHIVKEVLLEAQELAVRDHNVEYKSNLWVADSFCTRAWIVKGLRRNARGRQNRINYRYCHYFVRLREGTPPEHYYAPETSGYEKLEEYIKDQRKRRIYHSL